MPEEYDRDRDRDRWPDVKPEKPGKDTLEAAEDVFGLLKVAYDIDKDVFREKATAESTLGIYDRILAAREI